MSGAEPWTRGSPSRSVAPSEEVRPPASIVGEPASSWKSSAAGAAKSGSASWLPPVVVVMPPGRIREHLVAAEVREGDVERLSACALEVHLQVVGTSARDHVDRMGVHAERAGRRSPTTSSATSPTPPASLAIAVTFVTRTEPWNVFTRDAAGGLGVHDAVLQRPAAGHVRRHGARGRRAREHDEMVGDRRGRAVHEPGGVHHLARAPRAAGSRAVLRRVLGEANRIGAVLTTRGRGCPPWPWM